MKTRWRTVGQIVVSMVLVPQLFVSAYYFPLLISGPRRWEFWQVIASLGLSISWIAAPFFVAVAGLYRVLIQCRVPYGVVFLSMLAAGFGGVALWNTLIFDLFSYLRSTLPVLLCCTVTIGYMLAARIYRAGLPTVAQNKDKEELNLPE